MMQAIETRYKGYRFRSRLEARWAVFFDALGQQYKYEPEGFVLNDGTCYLPDFFTEIKVMLFNRYRGEYSDIGLFDIYFEIKPTKEQAKGAVENLYSNFDEIIAISTGSPCEYLFIISPMFTTHERSITYAHIGKNENNENCIFVFELNSQGVYSLARPMLDKVNYAREAARSARFEFGESGDG